MLTHAFERVDVPSQDQVDSFLPRFEPRQTLDPGDPISIGAMVGPEAFTEVKYLAHLGHFQALEAIPRLSAQLGEALCREQAGLARSYRLEDAQTAVVALGSVLGTIEDSIDELRDDGVAIGAIGIKSFRPFPLERVRELLAGVSRVVVVERAFAVGLGGIITPDVRMALAGTGVEVDTVIAGLGGRAVTAESLQAVFRQSITCIGVPWMFFIGSTIFVLPDMVLKSSSSCAFRLSSVIAYPVLGLGYTILRQLFNPIFTVLLTRNLLFDSGLHIPRPIVFQQKGSLRPRAVPGNPVSLPGTRKRERLWAATGPGHEPFCRESCNCIRDELSGILHERCF